MEFAADNNEHEFSNDRIEWERDDNGMPLYFWRRDDGSPNNEGDLIRYERLLTFQSEKTGKYYVIYTDNSYIDNGNLAVRGGTFEPDSENPEDTICCLGPNNWTDWAICIEKVNQRNLTNRKNRLSTKNEQNLKDL